MMRGVNSTSKLWVRRNLFRNLSTAGGHQVSLTKIVATIGPASESLPVIEHVVEAGMRIMRINFSHATYEEADLRARNIKRCRGVHSAVGGDFNLRAVMLDTQGPEIRTGSFTDGKKVQYEIGDLVTLTTNDTHRASQTTNTIWISYKNICNTVKLNSQILLDDGAIELRVEKIDKTINELSCRVINSGVLGNKKGVNLPGLVIDLPAMCEKDKIDIKWGIQNDVDFIAASFTRKAQDVHEIRDYMKSLLPLYHDKKHPLPGIISKIENVEALENFDEILAVSDGIMVARGDLGVEIPLQTLAIVQKDLVRRTNLAGKPVVVATQMLDSMQKNPRPTRAECTDVANAILDGADCVMLSGESAQGKYPVQSVTMMQNIIDETEGWSRIQPLAVIPKQSADNLEEAFASSIVAASKQLHSKCVICICHTGSLARNISKFKPSIPVVCFVESKKTGRMLQIYRGLHPVSAPKQIFDNGDYVESVNYAKSMGFCSSGDSVLVVSGEKLREEVNNMRFVKVV